MPGREPSDPGRPIPIPRECPVNRSVRLWIIALLLTLVSARWQRMTGPTHSLPGSVDLGGTAIHYVLERTHKGDGGQAVTIGHVPEGVTGVMEWKSWGSNEPWTAVAMARQADALGAELPHQPAGHKLWYRVHLTRETDTVTLPAERPAAIRFTGAVPPWILFPHILFMFLAMFLAARAGLAVLEPAPNLKALTYGTLLTLVIGGMVLGPFVTHYAFGPWWTGFPVGNDITDSKTLIALIGWIAAGLAVGRSKIAKAWVFLAALVMLAIFAIPHSWTGSEPTYAQLDAAGSPATPAVIPADTGAIEAAPDSAPAR